jgi:hypothetical protein
MSIGNLSNLIVGTNGTNNGIGEYEGGKWGLLDSSGKVLLPLNYDGLEYLGEKLYSYKAGEKWGIIRDDNTILLPPLFYSFHKFEEGLARFYITTKN